MKADEKSTESPLVLLIDDEEWTARSFESILKPEGYAVLRAYTGGQAVELASKIRPDVVLIDLRLPDISGTDLCTRLRELHTIRPSTPILIFSSGNLDREQQRAGFDAGAWGFILPPFDPADLLSRLAPLVDAKRDVDRILDASFLDPVTGFYNVQGLMRRITELNADSSRSRRPLAWVILGPARERGPDGPEAMPVPDLGDWIGPKEVTAAIGGLLNAATRSSDAVGRVGDADFLIVAPGADRAGAHRLAERVMRTMDENASRLELLTRLDLLARFYGSSDSSPASNPPEELLRRATDALRRDAHSGASGPKVGPFEGN